MITKLTFNWFYTPEPGEQYEQHVVGVNGVVRIAEELPVEPGDRLCYVVKFNNGTKEIIYNPCRVYLNE